MLRAFIRRFRDIAEFLRECELDSGGDSLDFWESMRDELLALKGRYLRSFNFDDVVLGSQREVMCACLILDEIVLVGNRDRVPELLDLLRNVEEWYGHGV